MGVEELLSRTIEAAKRLKAVRRSDLTRVVVGSTVQEKDVAFPTDSRPLEVARHERIPLRQSYARVGPKRPQRESGSLGAAGSGAAERRTSAQPDAERQEQALRLARAGSGVYWKRESPAALRVRCEGRYCDHREMRTDRGCTQLPWESVRWRDLGGTLGTNRHLNGGDTGTNDCGLGLPRSGVGRRARAAQGKQKTLTLSDWRWLKRRQAVEPTIAHLKAEHRMPRCHLKGQLGDALNSVWRLPTTICAG